MRDLRSAARCSAGGRRRGDRRRGRAAERQQAGARRAHGAGRSAAGTRSSCTRRAFPAYIFPESAARALAAMVKYGKSSGSANRADDRAASPVVDRDRAARLIAGARSERSRRDRRRPTRSRCFDAYGIGVAPARLARSADEAARIAAELGMPVVMKVVSPDIVHKTDAGGVVTGVASADEARDAFATIVTNVTRVRAPRRALDGVLVQEMIGRRRRDDRRRDAGSVVRSARDVRTGRHVRRGAARRRLSRGSGRRRGGALDARAASARHAARRCARSGAGGQGRRSSP